MLITDVTELHSEAQDISRLYMQHMRILYYNKSFIIITKALRDFLYIICFFLISRGKYFNLIDINKLLAVHMQNTDMLKIHFFRFNFHFLSCEST